MKGRAYFHMRCLHCGKRLSLLRKFSDGEFCSAEHRSLFERLNNDLGLQRLFASRGKADSGPPASSAQQSRKDKKEKADGQQAANVPPLGELVQGGPHKPVVARRINQPGLPPLLEPRDSLIPEPAIRAEYRGLTQSEEMALGGIGMLAISPAPPKGPEPIQPAGQLLMGAGAPLAIEAPPEKDPELVERLIAGAGPRIASRGVQFAAVEAEASWGSGDAALPGVALRLMPPGETAESGAHSSQPRGGSMEPGMLETQRPLGSGQPLRRQAAPVAGEPGRAIEPEYAPQPPAAGIRPAPLSFRQTGKLAARRIEPSAAPARRGLEAEPLEVGTERALPRLGLTPEAVSAPKPQEGMRLPELPALWSTPTATAVAASGQAACEYALAVPALRQRIVWSAEIGSTSLSALEQAPIDALLAWQVPELAPAAFAAAGPAMPATGFPPELLTIGQALEIEVVDAAQPAAVIEEEPFEQVAAAEQKAEQKAEQETEREAEQETEPAPPLHDAQRPLAMMRPLTRQPVVASLSKAAMRVEWAQSLKASVLFPVMRLKLDHADGSGSRSLRGDTRQRAARQRLMNVQERIPGGRFWRNAPADLKWIALALPLILALVVWSFRGSVAPVEASLPQQPDPSKTVVAKQVSKFQQVLLSRAAVRLYDDFRGGLGAWSGREGWARTWKYSDSSFLEPGDLAVYAPTIEMRDYTMEFLGQIERRSLNWIFRAKDLQNYYAMRIVITKGGPLPTASLVRYAVVGGKERGHLTLPLPMSIRPDTVYRVRMDVRGNQFTTYVQGQVVDNFEDGRLTEGGVGFWSPRGDRSLLRWVEVMHQYDYLGRLCALLAPYPLQSGGHQAD